MKQSTYGKYAGNAEVDIDVPHKKVTFNYPYGYVNEDLAYFTHTFYLLLGSGFGYCFFIVTAPFNRHFMTGVPLQAQLLILGFMFLLEQVFWLIVFGYISLILHKCSKTARVAFSKTNAIPFYLKPSKKLDLSKPYGKKYYIHDNKLILWDYSIAYFEYLYEGSNTLLRFYTKSVEDKPHLDRRIHYKFIAFFEFADPLVSGYMTYK